MWPWSSCTHAQSILQQPGENGTLSHQFQAACRRFHGAMGHCHCVEANLGDTEAPDSQLSAQQERRAPGLPD